MRDDLASKVRVYAAMVEAIDAAVEDLEVFAALSWRDAVHDVLASGVMTDAETRSMLDRADELLLSQRSAILERFPDVYSPGRPADVPRRCWWWHLDEGPQVRDEAMAAARQAQ